MCIWPITAQTENHSNLRTARGLGNKGQSESIEPGGGLDGRPFLSPGTPLPTYFCLLSL